MFSCGANNRMMTQVHYRDNKYAKKLRALEWRHAPEDLLENLWPSKIVFDIRKWEQPATDHTGQSMSVIQELYRRHRPEIEGMLVQIAHAVRVRFEVDVLVLCRSGVVASVALAEMFHAAAALNPDLTTCDEIEHHCKFWFWSKNCSKEANSTDVACPECGDLEVDRLTIVHTYLQYVPDTLRTCR